MPFKPAYFIDRPDAERRRWLLLSVLLKLAAVVALSFATSCMDASTSSEQAATYAGPSVAAEHGAYATPQSVGGYCNRGAGVYLSATDDAADLTVYVVWPAQHVTFSGPQLYLTTREDDHTKTEVAKLEDITLKAGESHTFHRAVDGPLMEVYADFAGDES